MEAARVKTSTSMSGFSRGFRDAQPPEISKAPSAETVLEGKKKKGGWASGFSGLFRRNKQPVATSGKKSSSSSDDERGASRVIAASYSQQPVATKLQPPRPPSTARDRYSPVVVHAARDAVSSPLQSEHSSSTASLSRKERREAILARAQARRNDDGGGSSSSDERDSLSGRGMSPAVGQQRQHHRRRHHYSQESLASNGHSSNSKSRSSRTERYLLRRSRDEESLVPRPPPVAGVIAPKCWPPVSPPPVDADKARSSPWGSTVIHQSASLATSPTTLLVTDESPVMLRKPPGSNSGGYNHLGIPTGRAQSALITHGKLSVHPPPPPPPRNPLKKSYLLQVNDPHQHPSRPTSFSFGEVRYPGGQQQHHHQQSYPLVHSLHDYQNVDQDGRVVLVDQQQYQQQRVNSMHSAPVERRGVLLNGAAQTTPILYTPPSRHHSAFFPSSVAIRNSPSPFQQHAESQERANRPPWVAKPIGSNNNNNPSNGTPAPVREFWRSKDTAQQQQHQAPPAPRQSARERLALSASASSLSCDAPSTARNAAASSPGGDQHPNRPFVTPTTAGSDTFVTYNGPSPVSPLQTTPQPNQNGGLGAKSNINNNNGNHNNSSNNNSQHPVRELSQLKPSTDRHLEQAICELEAIYRSLRLDGDEDLLDRAERRDLPTVHQQLATAGIRDNRSSLVCSGSESGGDPLHGPGITSDLDTMMNWSVSGSFESLAAPSTPRSGGASRVRAPPRRRSACPDKVADDMALRRLSSAARQSSQPKEYDQGSYLLVTPSLTAAEEQSNSSSSSNRGGSSEPDIVMDDVAVRQLRAANLLLKKVPDPQPPFGIPNTLCLGPVPPASPSDYLHAQVTPEKMDLRPLMHPTKYPDLVRDDLAYRNLRKDTGHTHAVNTDKLDDLLRENANERRGQPGDDKSLKKKRAVRSLSANIAQLIRQDAARPSGGGGVVDFSKKDDDDDDEEDRRYIDPNPFDPSADSLADLLLDDVVVSAIINNNNKPTVKTPRAVKHRSGLKRVTKSCEVEHPELITITRQTHPTASWVERAQLDDFGSTVGSSTETITPDQTGRKRTPALAQLFPTSALKQSSVSGEGSTTKSRAAEEMDHLISDLSEFAASSVPSSWQQSPCEVDSTTSSSGPPPPPPPSQPQQQQQQLALLSKPPTGATATDEVAPVYADHEWEESPLFRSQPQFNFARSSSPADSSDSGQISCCAREVRQILQQPSSSGTVGVEEAILVASSDQHVACCESSLDPACWIVHDEPPVSCTTPTITSTVTTTIATSTAPVPEPAPQILTSVPVVVVETISDRYDDPGSDDGIDSLPAVSSSSSRSSPEQWSNSSRQLSDEEEDEDDQVNEERRPSHVKNEETVSNESKTARWLSVASPMLGREEGKRSPDGGLLSSPVTARWFSIAHGFLWAGCVFTSLLTLCGLDLTTCAHLLLALLALAAVFCDIH